MTKERIPGWAFKLLKFFCPEDLFESIAGDMEESFKDDLLAYGSKEARRNYIFGTFRFIHPAILWRHHLKTPEMNFSLYKSHAKISLRSLAKGRLYSVINISGLAFGLAAFFLISAFSFHQKSYDRSHPDLDRLYRVNQTNVWNPEGSIMSSTPPPLGAALYNDFPEVEAALRINTPGSRTMRYQNDLGTVIAYNEDDVLAADSNFFSFFDIPLIEGDPRTALTGVGKVVISDKMASKYFNEQPALGKIIQMGADRIPLQVTAVAAPQKDNVHFDFDFLISMSSNPSVKQFDWSWIWTQMVTYVKLKAGTDPLSLEKKLVALQDQYVSATFARLGMSMAEYIGGDTGWNFYLQPVKDIHLGSAGIGNRIGDYGDRTTNNLLMILAYLILAIAVVNFVNLATARSSTRAKEIGVKKSFGVRQGAMIKQFLLESIILVSIATLLAFPIVVLLQSFITKFANITIALDVIPTNRWIIIALITPVIVGILGGLYPAFYLTRFKPVNVLKGSSADGKTNYRLRNVLVIAQFAIAIGLLAGSALIYQQMRFMTEKNLGFNQEGLLVINNVEKLGNQVASFRNEVTDVSHVQNASLSMEVPGRGNWEDIFMREGSKIKLPIGQVKIDDRFFDVMGLSLKSGSKFEKDREAHKNGVILNETAVRLFQWSEEEALGSRLLYPGYPDEITIIGIVEDFHTQSLRVDIAPLVFFNIDSDMWGDQRVLAIKYDISQPEAVVAAVGNIWKVMGSDIPFEYSFFDDEMRQLYVEEKQLGRLIGIFTCFSLFIAIIGLIGMASYSAEKRKKEIGIRKVMGASIWQIFLLVNKQYVQLFLIALVIAVPLSWNALDSWLENFAYRVTLSPVLFVYAGVAVIIFSLIAVGYLTLRAASVHPAKVLSDE